MFENQLRALLGTLALLPAASCIAFGGPAPTDLSPEKALNGFTPKPTQGPSIAELRKRQRGLEANTCGWIDRDYSSWVTCRTGRTCALYTASGVGMAGCCDGSDHQACGWASSCVDYRQYYSSSACDLNCDLNTFIRKCTNAAAPYCVTWTYASNNVKDFGCVETSSRTVETIYFSASLFSSSTSVKLLTLSGKDVATSITGVSSNLFGFTSNILTTGTDAAQETDPVAVAGGGGGGRNKKKKKSKVSIGLIVGVAIAGIAILFIIGAIILFFCLKAKRRRQVVEPQTASAGTGVPPAGSYNPQMQQQQQVPPPIPPVGSSQSPPPQHGYFAPGTPLPQSPYGQSVDQKGVYHYEQPAPSPVSSPSPAPTYVQPYNAPTNGAPPMPTPSPGPYPTPGPPPPQQPHGGNIHEIGGGR